MHKKLRKKVKQSSRATALMNRQQAEQRLRQRVPLHTSAYLAVGEESAPRQVALLRDLSPKGAYIFCDTQPNLGSPAYLTFVLTLPGGAVQVEAEGRVVRIDRAGQGAAPGIGLELDKVRLS